MGQELLNPPTVEGWHTGKEWIDGGTLTERINFSVGELSDPSKPGIEQIISRLKSNGSALSPDEFVDRCLELVGPLDVGETTRESLTQFAASQGDLNIGADRRCGREQRSRGAYATVDCIFEGISVCLIWFISASVH